jgi:hypothetical protein
MAAVLAFGALVGFAPGAGASVPSASPSPKFCKAVAKIGDTSSQLSDAASLGTQAKTVAKQFKTAAKSAPAKVKKAMNTIANFIGALGTKNATDLAEVYSGHGFQNYTKAIGVYVGAAAQCT